MRAAQVLIGLFQALFSLLIIASGLFLIALSRVADIRLDWFLLIEKNTSAFAIYGTIFLLIGVLLLFGCYLCCKRQYIVFKMGGAKISTSAQIIEKYINIYFKQAFSSHKIESLVSIVDNKICVQVNLPHVSADQQITTLQKIERDLAVIFKSILGYLPSFQVSVQF
ncbi:MAG: hypothetical protein K0S74_1208 [Chlamydiales bacterium]|jgi:hypothetical protein|nr:hypothetical protein [Chlamydiales bacterium]